MRNRGVTRVGKTGCMRGFAALVASLSLLASAGGAVAGSRSAPPPFPKLAGKWSHAEINVSIRGQEHTLILDHGRITRATPTQLTLRLFDGTVAVAPLAPSTLVTLGGRRSTPSALYPGLFAATMKIDGGRAVRVKASYTP